MPSFPNLSDPETQAIVQYVLSGDGPELAIEAAGEPGGGINQDLPVHWPTPVSRSRRAIRRWRHRGGTLNAIPSQYRRIRVEDSAGRVPGTGGARSEEHRTARTTAGRSTHGRRSWFSSAPYEFRPQNSAAFDKRTGQLLWESTLPMMGNATPITYEVGGRQYVVIAPRVARLKPWRSVGSDLCGVCAAPVDAPATGHGCALQS